MSSRFSGNAVGIGLMLAATACFTINDMLLKLALEALPTFQTVFLRSAVLCVLGFAALWGTGLQRQARQVFNRRVLLRNVLELLAVFGFAVALARVPLADLTAISQLSPMLVLLGGVVFFAERITALQVMLVISAFAGAILVAQPGVSGLSVFALLGFWNAACVAARDLYGRRIDHGVPGLVVAVSAGVVVLVGTGIATLVLEQWQMPTVRDMLVVAGAAGFLLLAHWLILSAYRAAPTGVVVPFCYASTIWALVAGALVFHTVPNGLAIAGMAIILVSGVGAVMAERWTRRLVVAP